LHGLVDRSIVRSRAGLKAVSISLGVLGAAALVQAGILVLTGSVALLADLIHNVGDALTAVPVGIAFLLRSFRAEKKQGSRSCSRSSSPRAWPCTSRSSG
jgi:divalent metal cation (Fe/Co/Zn/Cd) transporter